MLNIFLFGLFRFQPLECEPSTRHLSASCWNLLLLSESVYSLSTIILHGWNIKSFSSPVFKSGSIQQLWKRQRLTHISLEAISPHNSPWIILKYSCKGVTIKQNRIVVSHSQVIGFRHTHPLGYQILALSAGRQSGLQTQMVSVLKRQEVLTLY